MKSRTRFYGYERPSVTLPRKNRHRRTYSEQEKQDIVWLIDQGYPPLDVAAAWGVPVYAYLQPKLSSLPIYNSTIYDNYRNWKSAQQFAAFKERLRKS